MNRLLIATLAAVMLTGCASTAVTQGYRPANHAGAPWSISGSASCLSGELSININGAEAVKGKLSLWDCSGEASGTYQGKMVSATCVRGYSTLTCFVTVDNDRAASLVFTGL